MKAPAWSNVRREIPDLRFLADMRRSPLSHSSEIGRLCFRPRRATSHFFEPKSPRENMVGTRMVDYGLPGVIWLMIGLLVVQIIAVYFWGIEPARRSLEGLDPKA
jgi:hypothetical protein